MSVSLFHLKYSGAVIPALFAAAFGFAFDKDFVLAYVFVGLFGVWATGFWLTSDHLRRRRQEVHTRSARKRGTGEKLTRRLCLVKWTGVAAVGLASGLCAAFVWNKAIETDLHNPRGVIVPGNDSLTGACGDDNPKSTGTVIITGKSASITTRYPLPIVNFRGRDVLTVDKLPDGSSGFSFDAYSPDGKLVARVDNNRYTVNSNNISAFDRKDTHSLSVIDQYGKEVMRARFRNPREFEISGQFYVPGGVLNLDSIAQGVCLIPGDKTMSIYRFD